jgi:hypothetical protein
MMNETVTNDHFRDATKMVGADYYAVYVKRSAKLKGNFLLHAHAKSEGDALRIARAHGHQLPRWSYAVRVGREGYFPALRQAFG